MKLKDRRALVTGSGSGIGRAIARRFAEEGARVAVNDVDAKAAHATADEIDGLAVRADVADPDAVRAMFEMIRTNFGGLDILVNNAGIAETAGQDREELNARFEQRITEIMGGGPIKTQLEVIENMSDDDWDRMLRVHLYGTFHCSREAASFWMGRRISTRSSFRQNRYRASTWLYTTPPTGHGRCIGWTARPASSFRPCAVVSKPGAALSWPTTSMKDGR